MKIHAHIDADKVSLEFKEARRDLNRRTRDGLVRAGERVALPAAKRNAMRLKVEGRSVSGSLTVRATQRTAYLGTTLRGKQNRAVGLLEFGGTVRTKIVPKRGRRTESGRPPAVMTPFGPRASVTGPRHYRGRHFLGDAVSHNTGRIEQAISDEIVKAFDGLEADK